MKPVGKILMLLFGMAVMPSAVAHAHDDEAIVLRCNGVGANKSFERTYYINLSARSFCYDRCRWAMPLKNASDGMIDLSWQTEGNPLAAISHETSYARSTGLLLSRETVSNATFTDTRIVAECDSDALQAEPIVQFLANRSSGNQTP